MQQSRVGKGRADIKHQPLDLAITSLGALFSLPSALVGRRRKTNVHTIEEAWSGSDRAPR